MSINWSSVVMVAGIWNSVGGGVFFFDMPPRCACRWRLLVGWSESRLRLLIGNRWMSRDPEIVPAVLECS